MKDRIIRTPILAAVRSMYQRQDTGYDPYNSVRVRTLTLAQVEEARRREAEGILACYETNLTLVRQ